MLTPCHLGGILNVLDAHHLGDLVLPDIGNSAADATSDRAESPK
jgi:hypothetical protein